MPPERDLSSIDTEQACLLCERRARGLTVADVARRYRVGEDKVRAWIRKGELQAINTAAVLCGKPRWVILPDALVAFERVRQGGPPPKPAQRRRRQTLIDYYPD
jgi:hypothetical protein